MVADLWECSRDRLDIGSFLARYGHHGPNEGELSSRVWREDPAPVRDLVARYRTRAEESSPAATRTRLATERAERERRFLAELPAVQRPAARLVLRLAGAYVPLRGVAKASFLQCLDVARASARVLGTGWARSGALADPEDVFFLTAEEIAAGPPESARELVAQRRAERAEFERVDLPPVFTGQPLPERRPTRPAGDLAGIGVSPGVVEGIARVVEDPSFAEFEEGEILVARTTDPSWASVMFLSAGLVVDIGGPMSHAAVVARELGIPCVMNTQAGTSVIRTGDRCRIDGTSGAVQVLGRG
jgi:pyruvate,water dikinase